VHISIHGKAQHQNVHRLVAEAFLGPCPKHHQVNHKDLNKENNVLENLEYVTHAGNQQHAIRLLGKWHKPWNAKLTQEQVGELCEMRSRGASLSVLAYHFDVSAAAIYARLLKSGNYQRLPH
jgi:hypothetical protein